MFSKRLLATLLLLSGCNKSTGPNEGAGAGTLTIPLELEIEVLRNSSGDSLNIGFSFHLLGLLKSGSDEQHRLRTDGLLFALLFMNSDSLVLAYNLKGSQAAWAPYVSLRDSLHANLLDSAGIARYNAISDQHESEFFAMKSYVFSTCALASTGGKARVQSGDITLDVPVVFSSIAHAPDYPQEEYYIRFVINQAASRPAGAASVSLVGKTYTGTLKITCVDRLD